jgi:hypothetical protein
MNITNILLRMHKPKAGTQFSPTPMTGNMNCSKWRYRPRASRFPIFQRINIQLPNSFLEDIRHRSGSCKADTGEILDIIDEKAHRPRGDFREGSPSECYCEERLLHIKCLHEEIACLGLLHPRRYGLNSWDGLSSNGSFRHRSGILGLNNQWQSGDLQTKVEHPTFASRQVEGAD